MDIARPCVRHARDAHKTIGVPACYADASQRPTETSAMPLKQTVDAVQRSVAIREHRQHEPPEPASVCLSIGVSSS